MVLKSCSQHIYSSDVLELQGMASTQASGEHSPDLQQSNQACLLGKLGSVPAAATIGGQALPQVSALWGML